MTVEELYRAAMDLSDDSKALLAERLVAYLGTRIEPEVEKSHMEVVRRRRDEVLSGRVEALDGEAVMARVRKAIGR